VLAWAAMARPIHLFMRGEHQGRFSPEELRRLWDMSEIEPGALYWHRGLAAWRAVTEYQPPTAEQLGAPLGPVKLTTTHAIAGETVDEEVDIVSAECVIGVNVLQDLMTSLTDIVGGRSRTMQDALKTARGSCLDELRGEAQRLGADAVVGVDLDYSEVSSQGKSMILLVATGTAVRLLAVAPPVPAAG